MTTLLTDLPTNGKKTDIGFKARAPGPRVTANFYDSKFNLFISLRLDVFWKYMSISARPIAYFSRRRARNWALLFHCNCVFTFFNWIRFDNWPLNSMNRNGERRLWFFIVIMKLVLIWHLLNSNTYFIMQNINFLFHSLKKRKLPIPYNSRNYPHLRGEVKIVVNHDLVAPKRGKCIKLNTQLGA